MHDDRSAPNTATLRIAVFAGMAEIAGRRHVELPWGGGTVGDARRLVRAAYPALSPLLDRSAFAIGSRYVADDVALVVGDDVAIIPPVSGG